MNRKPDLHLASSSPRRREILAALGLEFSWRGVDIDEARRDDESSRELVLRLAKEKAAAARVAEGTLVLGSDTEVVLGERTLGKPADESDAVDMLLELSGRAHKVVTGVALRGADRLQTTLSVTEVRFREIRRDEARHYWQSGEPRDKAGAYGIQGLGGAFVESIRGSYSGVVGLPVFETVELLRNAGLDVIANGVRRR